MNRKSMNNQVRKYWLAKRLSIYSLIFVTVFTTLIVRGSLSFATNDGLSSPSQRPVFQKRKIKIGNLTLNVEIADTDARRAYGLMFREKLGRDEGMLFIFDNEEQRSFWMQNTLIPLSIGYISREKVLNEVVDMQPAVMGASRPKTYPSKKKAMFALEMNAGWFDRNKIRPGVSFKFADN